MIPDKSEQPETLVSLTVEEAVEFQYAVSDMGYGEAVWWSFVEMYDTHRKALIDKGLLERAYHLPTMDSGINVYFPQYAYSLTDLGAKVRANPDLIDIVLEY